MKRQPFRSSTAAACLALLAVAPAAAAQTQVICSDLDDPDRTRAVLGIAGSAADAAGTSRITGLEIITPEFLWPAPGQPETARFTAGSSDVSPDLARLDTVAIRTTEDADGVLRIIDFGVLRPDALSAEGLRGSLMLHEAWHNGRAAGSLYYSYEGSPPSVAALGCRRFDED
jgi:hypothetical protein